MYTVLVQYAPLSALTSVARTGCSAHACSALLASLARYLFFFFFAFGSFAGSSRERCKVRMIGDETVSGEDGCSGQ